MTDLEQMSKELERVQKREIDPFGQPLDKPETEQRITDEKPVESKQVEGWGNQKFGIRTRVSGDALVMAVDAKQLLRDRWHELARKLAADLTTNGYVIQVASVEFRAFRDHATLSEVLEIQCLGVNSLGIYRDNDLLKINTNVMLALLDQAEDKGELNAGR